MSKDNAKNDIQFLVVIFVVQIKVLAYQFLKDR